MILSSCMALLLGALATASIAVGLININKVFASLLKLDFQGIKLANPFALPVGVPAMAVLALVITLSHVKEIKVDNHTVIAYKKCEAKEAVAVATIKVPGCLIASR